MAAVKRKPIERARDRRLIAPMYLIEKISQGEIAERLNARGDVAYTITQQTVSNDLKALENEWLQAGLMDLDEAKARELARIDALECEYWEAWRESISSGVKVSKEKKRGDEVVTVRQEVTKASGDSRFLQGIQWCIEQRCKILGLLREGTTVHGDQYVAIKNETTILNLPEPLAPLSEEDQKIIDNASYIVVE